MSILVQCGWNRKPGVRFGWGRRASISAVTMRIEGRQVGGGMALVVGVLTVGVDAVVWLVRLVIMRIW